MTYKCFCVLLLFPPPLSSSYYLPVLIVSSRLFSVVTLTGNLSFLIIKNLEAEIMVQIVGGVILNLKTKNKNTIRFEKLSAGRNAKNYPSAATFLALDTFGYAQCI